VTIASWSAARRRALCVRPRLGVEQPPFIARLLDEWIVALALHCNVTVVEEDFDFLEVCDTIHPDFVVFEGVGICRCQPLRIANLSANAALPRAVFINEDPFCTSRPLLFRMIEAYGVTSMFGYGYAHMQEIPELAGRVHAVPHMIDGTLFRDYGLARHIPVSVFGGVNFPQLYAWRCANVPLFLHRFPTFVYTHPGYKTQAVHGFAVHGEAYARLLNQSHFSLADTTRCAYVVRKHLEIPASCSVLVAPETGALGDYGFVDMRNCVLGEGMTLLNKIAAVANDAELYRRICQGGHELAHARYTHRSWRYLVDWYEACRARRPGEVVVQQGIFGPFRAVAGSAIPAVRDCAVPDNEITAILRAARAAIHAGAELDEAERSLRDITGIHLMADPWLLLGVIALLRGQKTEASGYFFQPAARQAQRHEEFGFASDTRIVVDPVELAFILLLAWLMRDAGLRNLVDAQGQGVRHLALRRMRWLVDALDGKAQADAVEPGDVLPGDRTSIHWLGQEDTATWRGLMRRILAANAEPIPACLHAPA
jgi:hypothetical protein